MPRRCFVCKRNPFTDVEGHIDNITLHRIPKDKTLKEQWFTLLGIDRSRFISDYIEVCSSHFHEEDIEIKPSGRKWLKKGSLPKQYVNPNDRNTTNIQIRDDTEDVAAADLSMLKTTSELCSATHTISEENPCAAWTKFYSEESCSSTTLTGFESEGVPPSSNELELSSPTPNVTCTVSPKRRFIRYAGDISSTEFSSPAKNSQLRVLQNTILRKTRQIKTLQQRTRRLDRRVTNLKSLVQLLKRQNCVLRKIVEQS